MDAVSWDTLARLLHEAVALPPEQRAAFLDEVCTGDPDLRTEAQALLDAYGKPGRFDHLAEQLAAAQVETTAPSPRQVGPYRILHELGRGGMSVVYLAERADGQFEQQVALKLLQPSLDRDDFLRRFLAERQILARLNHPNVARVFDGGLTDDERPYFVMEYVEGLPITEYCDAHRLNVEARLRLFQDVCQAVAYAHRNLIVHRDLKPSNILVTEDGTVKLLDFGIAKLLDPEQHPQPLAVTRTGLRLMTPEYAAPEQVRGEAITTATDVYQLGVLLYELLTGHRPYRLLTTRLHDIERIICEHDPGKPSTAVSRVEEIERPGGNTKTLTPQLVSRARATSAKRLGRRLRGDLDTIMLMALRKEPERRYSSAEQLSEDLRRHLAGLPVLAQPDTLAYRASKFIRRHSVGVVATASVMVLLAGFAGAMARQAERTARERDKAEQVATFLVDLFERSDPAQARGDTLTVREVLDEGAERIRRELHDQADVQATMMDAIGRVYGNLGLFDEARPLLEEALDQRQRLFGQTHPDVALSMAHLGAMLRKAGAYEAADSLLHAALTLRRRLLGPDHPDVGETLGELGLLFYNKRDFEDAEPLLREAVRIRSNAFGNASPEVAAPLNNLALLLHVKGDYEAAEPLYREVLAIYRTMPGGDHPTLAVTMSNLGWLMQAMDDLDAAESLFRETLAMRRRLYGDAHPALANSLSALAGVLHRKGDDEAAEPLARESLALRRALLGPRHPRVAESLLHLGNILAKKTLYKEADSLYREAHTIFREQLGEEAVDVARVTYDMARLREEQGDYAHAASFYREAMAIYRTALGEQHPFTARAKSGLASILYAQAAYQEAAALGREALHTLRTAWSAEHTSVAQTQRLLGACLAALQRYDEAKPLLEEAYDVLKKKRGTWHPESVQTLERLIALYEAWGKPEEADRYRTMLLAAPRPSTSK